MLPLAFFGGIGPLEMVVIGTVAVLLFGSRLPSVARSAGKSLTEFKRGMQDLQSDFRRSIDLEETMRDNPPIASDDSTDNSETSSSEDDDQPEEIEGYPSTKSPAI